MFGQGNMWGNDEFAGNDMLNGNNFAFGAPQSDLTTLTDLSGDNAVSFGEQNPFGNFGQGGMTPPTFGGQGGQFNQQPPQAAQTQEK